jgi:hypothetical protein
MSVHAVRQVLHAEHMRLAHIVPRLTRDECPLNSSQRILGSTQTVRLRGVEVTQGAEYIPSGGIDLPEVTAGLFDGKGVRRRWSESGMGNRFRRRHGRRGANGRAAASQCRC